MIIEATTIWRQREYERKRRWWRKLHPLVTKEQIAKTPPTKLTVSTLNDEIFSERTNLIVDTPYGPMLLCNVPIKALS